MPVFENMSIIEISLLLISSFAGSFISAAMGLGGGVLLLGVITQFLPALAVIPVHGVVQLGSNVGRAGLLRRYIDTKTCLYFMLGSLLGAFIGGQIVFVLNADYLRLIIALFILSSIWKFKIPVKKSAMPLIVAGGWLSTVLTMFVGATGPFVAAMLQAKSYVREQRVATMAACMVIQHFLKVLVFGVLGFQFSAYIPLITGMVLVGFAGTYIGKKLLIRTSEKQFKFGLNLVLILLSIRLLWLSVKNLWGL